MDRCLIVLFMVGGHAWLLSWNSGVRDLRGTPSSRLRIVVDRSSKTWFTGLKSWMFENVVLMRGR